MNMVGRLPLENIAPAFRLAIYIYIKRLVGSGPLFRHGKTNLVKKRVEIPSPKFKHSKKLNHHNSPKGGLGIRPEIPPYFLARPREIWAKDCKVSTYLCFLPFFGLCSCSLKPEFLLPWDGRLWELSRNLTEKGGYSPTLLYFRGRSFKTRWFRTPFPTRQDQFSQKESVDSISEVQTFQKTQPPQFPKGGLGIRPEIPPYFLARPREIWAKDCKVELGPARPGKFPVHLPLFFTLCSAFFPLAL